MAGDDKTEEATEKRKKDAREQEGKTIKSQEVNTAVFLLGTFVAFSLLAKLMFQMIRYAIAEWLGHAGDTLIVNSEFVTQNSVKMAAYILVIIGPLLIIATALSIIPNGIQTRWLMTFKPLKFDFKKFDVIKGFGKFFSMNATVNVLKGIIELLAIGLVVYNQIKAIIPDIKRLPDMDIIQAVAFISSKIFGIVTTIAVIFVFIAAGDYLYQRYSYNKSLKMSKDEIKEEYKQMEGDPKIKAKIKQKQQQIAMNRMMKEVPSADVVVRNPTHYAAALRYDAENFAKSHSAPIIVAKGKDHLALRIVSIAQENGVSVIENKPLAHMLFKTDLGLQIPPEVYSEVAVIYAEIMELKKKSP